MSKGLEGVSVGQTKISRVDGHIGRLVYRGYDIRDLAHHVSYEEIVHLLWFGELPNRAQLSELKRKLINYRALPAHVLAIARQLPKNTEPMDALRTLVSALGAGVALKQADLEHAIAVTAQMPVLLAAFDRLRRGLEPVAPRADLDHASNYLYMLHGKEATLTQVNSLDTYLLMLADHGMNASTFTARVVASTWSDLYSCVAAGIGALKGPLHGGAPALVLNMIEAIGKPANTEKWMRDALARKERLMGFGHRVYKTTDPRAEIFRDLAREVCEPELFAVYQSAEETGLRILHETHGQLYMNVEFYSSAVLHAVGFPKDLFTPAFAVSRTAGWTAHILEQVADNRLIRPDVDYVGPEPHAVVPLEKRN